MYLTSTFLVLPRKLLLGPARNLFFILVSATLNFSRAYNTTHLVILTTMALDQQRKGCLSRNGSTGSSPSQHATKGLDTAV